VNFFTSSSSGPTAAPGPPYLRWLAGSAAGAFALVWLYLWALPITYQNPDYARWLAKQRMIDACRLGAVAVVGDSRPLVAVVPALLSMPVANLAMTATSPVESYFAVARALACPHPPKLVVIAHTALHFAADPDYWDRGPLFGFLDYADMREVDRLAAGLHDAAGRGASAADALPAWARDWLYRVRFPPFYFASLRGALGDARWWRNWGVLHETERSGGQYFFGNADGYAGLAEDSGMTEFRASPLVDGYFERSLRLLQARGVAVLYVAVPMNQTTYDHVAPGVEAAFLAYLQAKERAFGNFHLAGPALACWPDRFFGDFYAHFNRPGAEAFSRELDDLLRRALAGETAPALPDRCARAVAAEK
jgi:hypothetical protein